MPSVIPFRAVRPSRDKVHLVVTKPYYHYRSHILKARLEHNPYSFLHIIEPDDLEVSKDLGLEEKFARVRQEYDRFIGEHVFVKEEFPSFYLYRQTTPERSYLGVIGAVSVEDYESGLVKKHEHTLEQRENLFTDYLDHVEFNAEPVLLSYHHEIPLEVQMADVLLTRPEYEFTTSDLILHELWVVSDPPHVLALEQRFMETPAFYIADGHHRSASSARLHERRVAEGRDPVASSHFLCYLLEEDELAILEYNRLVKELGDLNPESLLAALQVKFEVSLLPEGQTIVEDGTFHMYLDGKWYLLKRDRAFPAGTTSVQMLDAYLLNEEILEPILGIKDLRNDKRVAFIDGSVGREGLSISVDQCVNAVGFRLAPVDIEELKAVADENGIMPPKSTWIEPKLRSGMTIYELSNDS